MRALLLSCVVPCSAVVFAVGLAGSPAQAEPLFTLHWFEGGFYDLYPGSDQADFTLDEPMRVRVTWWGESYSLAFWEGGGSEFPALGSIRAWLFEGEAYSLDRPDLLRFPPSWHHRFWGVEEGGHITLPDDPDGLYSELTYHSGSEVLLLEPGTYTLGVHASGDKQGGYGRVWAQVEVLPVPEPASLLLLLMGVTALTVATARSVASPPHQRASHLLGAPGAAPRN